MKFLRFATLGALLIGGLSASTDAMAGKKDASATEGAEKELPKIQLTGIPEFDPVFSKALAMQETLDAAHLKVVTVRTQLNTGLGIATNAPLKLALEDLKTKAQGKIKVVLKGSRPSLAASEAVPANVQAGIDQANVLFDAGEESAKTGMELKPEAIALGSACADFPGRVNELISTDLLAAAKATKTVLANGKTIAATPARIERLLSDAQSMWNDVNGVFGG